ncbi:MAG: adaptor protein MecA, partial [Bacilli bacterium]
MDIERINDHTIRFYISYVDIEERGYDRNEIWNNREQGERLFWDLMEGIDLQDEFLTDGPLWIQVKAHNKGIEVTVTNAQFAIKDDMLDFPITLFDQDVRPHFVQMGEDAGDSDETFDDDQADYDRDFVFRFASFEDCI